jgi:iron complex outermembrane receptor protein
MQLAAAVFHSNYTDMQISVVDGPAPTLTNAGDATIDGAELEVAWQPITDLTINAFSGYLDAHYDTLSDRALRSGVTLSKKLPNTSKWQYGASAAYEVPIGTNWTLRPYVEWSYRSDLYIDAANEPLLHQDGYSLLSAVLTLATADDRWAVSLSGRNLLDEKYLVSGIAQYNIGEIEGQYERPLQWNLSLRAKF